MTSSSNSSPKSAFTPTSSSASPSAITQRAHPPTQSHSFTHSSPTQPHLPTHPHPSAQLHHSRSPVNLSSHAPRQTPTVFLGMSGGVDSSVAALLLKQQGYHVVGIYMKNWSEDLPGMQCPWAEDLADAKRVATKLAIDLEIFDFQSQYKHHVVDYMLSEFKRGNTPNPDIMCNSAIKFKLFLDTALERGADLIATGHYARVIKNQLTLAVDSDKDQTYFLYRISQAALDKTIFPIGHLHKSAVKKLAADHGLHNAFKKESMGVCFVGDVGIKDFLQEYLPKQPGPVLDFDTKQNLGTHDGAMFYTIGQRHGLSSGHNLPLYIVDKDITANIIYVSQNINHKRLWTDKIVLTDFFFRTPPTPGATLTVRLRHRAPLIPVELRNHTLYFSTPIKRPAPGQSAVLYQGQACLGGGIIT